MRIVNWSFFTNSGWDIDHPECIKPLLPEEHYPFKNLTKESVKKRKGVIFLKCPAHTDFIKNTFVMCAPFDLTIDIEVNHETGNGRLHCENLTQEQFETIIDTRFLFDGECGISPYPLIGVDWLCTFTAQESTMIQLLPAFMHYNDFTSKTTVIPGEYDISKWTRPVELVFEIKNIKERIVIKKGDAIAYIKFLCDDRVKLVEQPTPWTETKLCNEIRQSNRYRPLTERYAELEKARAAKAAGCPYEPPSK